ncbi:formate dehydrogenase accessory sulfurtransferase FdhD [Parapedobacter indicus]|uniref:Sulfur carrier protein FdhD n=1 Tax=Parapedobacter indicus TaxID=1477437 RepID=A0A1I3RV15_9SPHI|nr:formate dehydrogenase accessory sulfurtransferase FdhD [Parapedobacter indicus]PPK99961.1 FdhD protein [Parapedobacter indicus]SFJ50413.1 FdhD protein [Parapedobacter indicus]
MREFTAGSIKPIQVTKVNGHADTLFPDVLSVEEPLEIRISYGPGHERMQKSISVTMRTPGNDPELALGFLFTEGIITSYETIQSTQHAGMNCSVQKENIVLVNFTEDFVPRLHQADRNFYTTSSCGVCGKSSIQSIKTVSPFLTNKKPKLDLSKDVLYPLREKLRAAQSGFAATGGIHASGLFTMLGELVDLREDVGRHNALDKLIGNALMNNALPLNQHILLLSGRASFELIQKAAMAGISLIAAIGAPSSLAVELAEELGITLIGFLKEESFNIYNLSDNVLIRTD